MWFNFYSNLSRDWPAPPAPPSCVINDCSWASESTDAFPQALNSKVISSGFPLSSLKKSWHLEYILYIKTQSNKLTKVGRSAASKHSWTSSNHMMSLVSLWAEAPRCSALFWAWLWIFLFFPFFFPQDYFLVFEAQKPPASFPTVLLLWFPGFGSIGQNKRLL